MRKSTKTIAIVLSLVMVACAFCATLSVSAEDTNVLLGASYTVTGNPSTSLVDSGNMITDGAYRGDGTNNFNGISGVAGVTLEYTGTYAETAVEFAFDEATTIAQLVVKSVRAFFLDASVNRHCNVAKVEVTADGLNYTACEFTTNYVAIEGAPESETSDKSATGPQYHDLIVNVTGASDVMGLKITFNTARPDGSNAYIVQFDEIEGYASVGGDDTTVDTTEDPTSETPVSSEEPVSSEDPTSEAPVDYTTFLMTLTDNGDGTATVDFSLPEGIGNGKIVFNVTDKLSYIANSIHSEDGSAPVNPAYNRDGITGYCVSFATATTYTAGTVILSADFNIAEGATIGVDDVIVPLWEIGDGYRFLATEEDGDVDKVYVPFEAETSSEESSSEEPVSSDEPISEESSSEEPVSSDEPISEESSTVESSEASTVDSSEASSEESSENPDTPTGDAGIVAFAILAVISGAAVVVLKKRA